MMLIAVCCALAACGLVAEQFIRGRGARAALARVSEYGQTSAVTIASGEPARRLPGAPVFAAITLKVVPGRDRAKTAAQLHAAGFGRQVELFLALKAVLALSGLLVGGAYGVGGGVAKVLECAIALAAIGFIGPDIVVNLRAKKRRERMLGEFPNALDLLAVIVEAGLGLDAALVRYATTAEGPLAKEIGLLATELRVARSREEAFARFVERVPSPETKAFARAVGHADTLGVSLTGTLRAQASDSRYRRQSAAEEEANKAPVKMLFPTVLCIFPALFVVVLGPPMMSLLGGL